MPLLYIINEFNCFFVRIQNSKLSEYYVLRCFLDVCQCTMELFNLIVISVFHFIIIQSLVVGLHQSALSRDQNSFVTYGNFVPDFYQHLLAIRVRSTSVENENECPFSCAYEHRCYAFNIATYRDSKGHYLCELLTTDKYRAQNQLRANASFHHYSPWVGLLAFFNLLFWANWMKISLSKLSFLALYVAFYP